MGESVYGGETQENLREVSRAVPQMVSGQERDTALAEQFFFGGEEQVVGILAMIRQIVSNGWDKEWASDEQGNQIEEWRDDAVNFNLLAAKLKALFILEDTVDFMTHYEASRFVDIALDEQSESMEADYYAWQTAPGRTKEDVLNVIDKAIEKAKAGRHGHQP